MLYIKDTSVLLRIGYTHTHTLSFLIVIIWPCLFVARVTLVAAAVLNIEVATVGCHTHTSHIFIMHKYVFFSRSN